MWAIMMVGMMLPSAGPVISFFARVERRKNEDGSPFLPIAAFTSGYVLKLFAIEFRQMAH